MELLATDIGGYVSTLIDFGELRGRSLRVRPWASGTVAGESTSAVLHAEDALD